MTDQAISIPFMRYNLVHPSGHEQVFSAQDAPIANEVAVAISYNGTTQAVMMATPADLEDFAYGFTLSEGFAHPHEIDDINIVELEKGIDIQIWLTPDAAQRLQQRKRTMMGPVGCGLCGIDSIEQALKHPAPLKHHASVQMSACQITRAISDLSQQQPLHDQTRSAHGAGLWDGERFIALKEDVGRHNALDKLIGSLAQAAPSPTGAIVITSRVSIDLVQKTAALGVFIMIALSSPTSAAVMLADKLKITLICNAKSDAFNIYTHPYRITSSPANLATNTSKT